MVQDGFEGGAGVGAGKGGDDDGWLRTGGMGASQEARVRDVRTLGEGGEVQPGGEEEEEEIPDMEDEEDDEEAIIRDPKGQGTSAYVFISPSPSPSSHHSATHTHAQANIY